MIKILLAAIALLLATSCSSSKFTLTNSSVYNNADLASYKKFKIVEPEDGQLPPGILFSDFGNIAYSIVTELDARGYTLDQQEPDMLIYIGMYLGTDIQTKEALPIDRYGYVPHWFGPRANYVRSYYGGTSVIEDINQKGTMIVDFVDAKKNMHIFSASVSNVIDEGHAGEHIRNLQTINEVVAKLLSKYPIPNPNTAKKTKK